MGNRSMLAFPPPVAQGDPWRFPLCDATAMALCTALVGDSSQRVAALAAAMAVDPLLVIWALCHASGQSDSASQFSQRSLAEIAQWLAPQLGEMLDWPSGAPVAEFTGQQHGKFAALVAESVGAAEAAASLDSSDDPIRGQRYVQALIARWDDWFAAARFGASGADIPPPQNPLAAVAPSAAETPQVAGVSDPAWRRWLTEIPGVQSLLPALAARERSIADMCKRFDERLHAAKMEALKEFAYGAGHELNNPLANIASRAQTLLREETNPERRRRLAAMNTQAFRAHEMLADLMLFARPPQLNRGEVDLVQLADDVLRELEEDAAAAQIALHHPTRRDPLWIDADAVQLRVALRAVCVNSIEAIGQKGNLTIELCLSDADARSGIAGDVVQMVVSDDGPGIPQYLYSKIFDPFYSGREAGRGLGFGLCKCWRIVEQHGGRMHVESQAGHGAIFTLSLPAAKTPVSSPLPAGHVNRA